MPLFPHGPFGMKIPDDDRAHAALAEALGGHDEAETVRRLGSMLLSAEGKPGDMQFSGRKTLEAIDKLVGDEFSFAKPYKGLVYFNQNRGTPWIMEAKVDYASRPTVTQFIAERWLGGGTPWELHVSLYTERPGQRFLPLTAEERGEKEECRREWDPKHYLSGDEVTAVYSQSVDGSDVDQYFRFYHGKAGSHKFELEYHRNTLVERMYPIRSEYVATFRLTVGKKGEPYRTYYFRPGNAEKPPRVSINDPDVPALGDRFDERLPGCTWRYDFTYRRVSDPTSADMFDRLVTTEHTLPKTFVERWEKGFAQKWEMQLRGWMARANERAHAPGSAAYDCTRDHFRAIGGAPARKRPASAMW